MARQISSITLDYDGDSIILHDSQNASMEDVDFYNVEMWTPGTSTAIISKNI